MPKRFLTILALAAVLSACAHPSSIDSGARSRTVTVDRTDTGRVIALQTGDRLVVSLDTLSGTEWRLLSYPKDVLSRHSGSAATGRFEFDAKAAGTGRIELMIQPSCGKEGSPPCVPDDNPVDGIGGVPPTRPVTFDIRVT